MKTATKYGGIRGGVDIETSFHVAKFHAKSNIMALVALWEP